MTTTAPSSSPPRLDLTLPPFQQELVNVLDDANYDRGSVALYTMVPNMPISRLEEIAAIPQEEWENTYMDTKLMRPAKPKADFVGKKLADVVAAHVAMDKELQPIGDGAAQAGWWPHVFIVVTNTDIEDHGLLLVYADVPDKDEEDAGEDKTGSGEEGPKMGKFFFQSKNMYDILSGIVLSGYGFDELEDMYGMDSENKEDTEDGEDEGENDEVI
ncbi:hypothetical protein F5B20DRAFT_591989 [Whalleya microplaca]|nr:hypothetical protein F5B20DRAFT_591989 [Whalleya microplaca]